jgi:hypothetical protein
MFRLARFGARGLNIAQRAPIGPNLAETDTFGKV